jgi:threonine aldolase
MSTVELEFRSDNCGRAAPEILEALVRSNNGTALGYGADDLTASLQDRMSALFERPVRVFPIPTGTGANALALAATTTSFSAVYCSPESHINTSECNAAGFFGSGLKVTPLSGQFGKLDPNALEHAVTTAGKGQAHKSQPAAVNLVQATDLGAVMPNNIALEFAQHGGYTIAQPPFPLRDFTVSLHWSRRYQDDPANLWLRKLVVELFAEPSE